MKEIKKDIRVELKFVLDANQYFNQFLKWLYIKKPSIKRHHPQRKINNIYFDRSDLRSYKENLRGDSYKRKIRVRWYNDNEQHFQLEVKNKINDVILKVNYDTELDFNESTKEVYYQGTHYYPVVYNEYFREYYIYENSIRVTLDKKLRYSSCLTRDIKNIISGGNQYILEIKFPSDIDQRTYDSFFRLFPFTRNNFSKYFHAYNGLFN